MRLDDIGIKFGTDKASKHPKLLPKEYCDVYELFTKEKRLKFKNIFEFGIAKGASLYMWEEWFPNANIYGFDISKVNISTDRIKSLNVDCTSDEASEYSKKIRPDFIIDDASHTVESHIKSFNLNFKNLKKGGIYAIEDLYTCFLESYGGNSSFCDVKNRTVEWLFELSKCIYFSKYSKEEQKNILKKYPYAKEIKSVSFFKNVAIIEKK